MQAIVFQRLTETVVSVLCFFFIKLLLNFMSLDGKAGNHYGRKGNQTFQYFF